MRYYELMTEAVVAYERDDLVVWRDPSKADFARAYRTVERSHNEGLRAILTADGSVFYWNGYFANHDEIAGWVKIDGIWLHLWRDRVELDTPSVDVGSLRSMDKHDLAKLRVACDTITQNQYVIRIYGKTVNIMCDDGGMEQWSHEIFPHQNQKPNFEQIFQDIYKSVFGHAPSGTFASGEESLQWRETFGNPKMRLATGDGIHYTVSITGTISGVQVNVKQTATVGDDIAVRLKQELQHQLKRESDA